MRMQPTMQSRGHQGGQALVLAARLGSAAHDAHYRIAAHNLAVGRVNSEDCHRAQLGCLHGMGSAWAGRYQKTCDAYTSTTQLPARDGQLPAVGCAPAQLCACLMVPCLHSARRHARGQPGTAPGPALQQLRPHLAVGAAAQHVVNGSHAVAMHHRLLDVDEHGSEHRL